MKPSPHFQLPQDLPPTTALALFDFFNNMADTLWQQYEPQLIESILEDRNLSPSSQIEFEFDDDIEF